MSDEAKCPACRGRLHTKEGAWGGADSGVSCSACGAEFEEAEDFAPLAYFDARPRLPTPEEEAAHRDAHGEGAGWMVVIDQPGHSAPISWSAPPRTSWDVLVKAGTIKVPQKCWPHVNGRPVKGPAGW